MDLKLPIQSLVKGEVTDDQTALDNFSHDASIFELTPQLIMAPKDSEDIKTLVKYINSHPNLNLSLTPRAAGTDMSGAAICDSIILDMTKYFNKILEVGENSATTQPGVFYRDFEKETLKDNLLLPCYTSSREICTVGGMVANNSAGEKSLEYGQTKDYVKALTVILADGNEVKMYPLTKQELHKKITQDDLEGQIYEQIWQLIKENHDLITKAKPQTSKNSTGYLLWEVYNEDKFDLSKLVVGSQGTLGVITEIEFKLVTPKPFSYTLVITLEDLKILDQLIKQVLTFQPESFECFDDKTLEAAIKFMPEVASEVSSSPIPLVLLAEFTGSSDQEALLQAESAQKALSVKTKILKTSEAKNYWKIRRESFNLLRQHSQNMKAAPFIDDIIVNPEHLEEFLPKLNTILDQYKTKLVYTMAGHIGNGNFHIIPLMDLSNPEVRKIIPEISEKIFDLVFEFKGSMSAEHNDGLVRGPYLTKMYGEQTYQLFKKVKNIFDPQNIFNPHKKTDATFEYSYEHLVK